MAYRVATRIRKFKDKKLFVFDLDGTLTPSKSDMEPATAALLTRLLKEKMVAVIGGGTYRQFQEQFLKRLKCPTALLARLFLFPTTSTAFYRYERGRWREVYRERLHDAERRKIRGAFTQAFREAGYRHPRKRYGAILEDRGTQITFSALGQRAPVGLKERWNKTHDVRPALMRLIKKHLPEFEVRRGGLTSIDVTRRGIDKAYGVLQIKKHLKVPVNDMLFIGDALYPGGNDYAALQTGIDYLQVRGPDETRMCIQALLSLPPHK